MKKLLQLSMFFILLFATNVTTQAAIRYVKPTATGTGDGLSWANASANVQGMINASASGDQVWVAAGTYYPTLDVTGAIPTNASTKTFLMKSGVSVYGGFAGTETLLTQANPATNVTILSGDFNNDDVVTNANNAATLSITGNTENAYHVVTSNNPNAPITLNGCTISGGNTDAGNNPYLGIAGLNRYGAGVFSLNGGTNFTISQCLIKNNTANRFGGGIYFRDGSPTITNSKVFNNIADDGGGIFHPTGNTNMTNIAVFGNKATYNGGGLELSGNHNINGIAVYNNYAIVKGGGISVLSKSTNAILNAVVYGNKRGSDGAGIYNFSNSSNQAWQNATIINNGVYNEVGSTLSATPLFTNCIIWGAGVTNQGANTPTYTNCNVQGVAASGTNISTNPIFKDINNPAGVDGFWMTDDDGLQLGCNSPSYNTGTNTDAPLLDILGNGIFATTKDMGAYESQVDVTIVPIAPTATPQTFCGSTTVASLTTTSGINIKWYAAATAGTALASTTTLVTGTSYYASQTVGACESATRTAVAVTVNPSQPTVYVNKNATGLNNGTSWANAFVNLQDGINACGATEVWVAKGTYLPTLLVLGNNSGDNRGKSFILKNGVAVYGGFVGTETALTQRNWTTNTTILSGDFNNDDSGFTNNTENAYHVVFTFGVTAVTRLDGFTIKGGNANNTTFVDLGFSSGRWHARGAGIFSNGGGTNLNLQNLIISQNIAAIQGGGIDNYSSSSPTINNVTIANNSSYLGGGISNSSSRPALINVTITNNKAVNNGGGIYNISSSPILTNVTITNNTAYSGGGIYNYNFSSPIITNVTIANNNATNNCGGIYNDLRCNPNIKNSIIWGNTGSITPNIYNDSSTPVINYSNIEGGYAGTGNINTDPLFVNQSNPAGVDGFWMTDDDGLRLSCGSPSYNTGTNTDAPLLDILGNGIFATTKDMGAYESQVDVTIVPIAPTATPQTFCGSATVASLTTTSGTNIKWYVAATGGIALESTTTLVTGTSYYASQTVGACESASRAVVLVTVNPSQPIVYVNKNATGLNNGSSWTNAYIKLQDGINACGATQVWVAKGTYLPTEFVPSSVATDNRSKSIMLKSGVSVYGGFEGTETALNQRNWATNPTILSGDFSNNDIVTGTGATLVFANNIENAYHVVYGENIITATILDGFTIKNGHADLANSANTNSGFQNGNELGAGVLLLNCNNVLKINNVAVVNNKASVGGGVINLYSNAEFTNVSIVNNYAINFAGITSQTSNSVLTNVTICGNNNVGFGGALANFDSNLTVKNTIIWGNIQNGTAAGIVNINSNPIISYSNIEGLAASGTNISSDPLFTNSADPDGADNIFMTADDGLALQINSPSIDTGTNSGAPVLDILGNPIFNTTKDMGAHEFQGGNTCLTSTAWNGSAWSNGNPSLTKNVVFSGNYTASANIEACSVAVAGSSTITFPSGFSLVIKNEISVASSATIIFESGSSLVQTEGTLNNNTGNIIYKQNAVVKKLDYVFWSSPVINFANTAVYPGTPVATTLSWLPTAANNNGSAGDWMGLSENMIAGKGYAIRVPSSISASVPTTVTTTFVGVPQNGDYSFAISRSNLSGADITAPNGATITANDDNWNLVGNPYPSAIDADAFLVANPNIQGSIDLWTHGTAPSATAAQPFYGSYANNYSAADYITYNSFASQAGPNTFNGKIAAGQSFFVKMIDGPTAAASSVSFKNNLRSAAFDNNQFYRTLATSTEKHRIWLDLSSGSNGSVNRIVVGYAANASNQFDRLFDATSDYQGSQSFFSMIDNGIYAIQAKAVPFVNTDTIPLGFAVPATGNYKIGIHAADGLFHNNEQMVYLQDNLTGTIHNLSTQPYTFTTAAGGNKNRFVVRFTNATLSQNETIKINNEIIVFSEEQSIYINSTIDDIAAVQIFDIRGRLISENKNINSKKSRIDNLNIAQQIIILKIKTIDNKLIFKKIVF